MSAADDPVFADEIARTLRDELGARTVYRLLARHERDAELERLFEVLADEVDVLEHDLRAVIAALDVAGREKSPLRWIAHRVLGVLARVGMHGFVVRLCLESEEVLARRYAGFAHWLAGLGHADAARACDRLAERKSRRARTLRAWVPR